MDSNNLANNVSVIVFSRNRGLFLNRLAGVLNNLHFGGTLIIADASEQDTYTQTTSMLQDLNLGYKLLHLNEVRTPDQSISNNINKSIIKAAAKVTTPYAMLTCDDDIPCPRSLDYFAKFLTNENDYSGVVGELLWLNLNSNGVPIPAFRHKNLLGKLSTNNMIAQGNRQQSLHAYMGSAIGNTGSTRALNFFKRPFTVMFSVIRSETLNYLVPEDHEEIKFPHFSAEYNWFFNIVISGNIKKMNRPHIFRQLHSSNLSIKDRNHPYPDFIEAISSESWSTDVKKFLNNMSKSLQRVDGSDADRAMQDAMEILTEIIRLRIGTGEKLPLQHRLMLFFDELKYLSDISRSGQTLKEAINAIEMFPIQTT